MDFSARLGCRLGRQTIRPFNRGRSLERSAAGLACAHALRPTFPDEPRGFFQPLSVPMLMGILGALICGWKTPFEYRVWLWLPVTMFLILWVLTPTVFWPMNHELYLAASSSSGKSEAEVIQMARRWIILDWLRVAMIAAGFVSSVRAISLPIAAKSSS